MSTAIRQKTLISFFKSYLRLLGRGKGRTVMSNPALIFTKKAKAGEFDKIDDEAYNRLLRETEEFSSLWHGKSDQPGFAVLVEALSRMAMNEDQLDRCASILADAYANSALFSFVSDPDRNEIFMNIASQEDYTMDEPEEEQSPAFHMNHEVLRSPASIYAYLKTEIYGQDEACRAAATFLWNHVRGRRRNMVFAGPTGCGKTEIWRVLSRIFPAISIIDTPTMVPDGYKGSLYPRNIWDGISPRQRSRAIIVLDEFDKLLENTGSTVNFSSLLQTEFLRMMDGDTIRYGKGDGPSQPPMSVNCAHVSFVLCGSFETMLKNQKRAASASTCIGFSSAARSRHVPSGLVSQEGTTRTVKKGAWPVSVIDDPDAVSAKDAPAAVSAKDDPDAASAKDAPAAVSAKDDPAAVSAKGSASTDSKKNRPGLVPVKERYGDTLEKDSYGSYTSDDLIRFAGMRREIAGRVSRIVPLRPLNSSDYRQILASPDLSPVARLSKEYGIPITISDALAESLAKEAADSTLGVRFIRSRLQLLCDHELFDNPDAESLAFGLSINF